MKIFFIIFPLLLSFNSFANNEEMVSSFQNEMKKQCGERFHKFSKKLLVKILISKKTSKEPCHDDLIVYISTKCKQLQCNEIIDVYNQVYNDSKGNVYDK